MAAHLLRKFSNRLPVWLAKFLGNLWPPFLGAGIKIIAATEDYRFFKVCLKRSWYNSNYVGTQFGGSMYSMTDPFYMLMVINNLGPDYVVWDKSAKIEFKKPGRTHLYAEFKLTEEELIFLQQKTNEHGKYTFNKTIDIHDENQVVIATIEKEIYIRLKKK